MSLLCLKNCFEGEFPKYSLTPRPCPSDFFKFCCLCSPCSLPWAFLLKRPQSRVPGTRNPVVLLPPNHLKFQNHLTVC